MLVPDAIEIIENRLYYAALDITPPNTDAIHYFSIDEELIYNNFFLDFGPLNLGQSIQFCAILERKLNKISKKKKIYYLSSTNGQQRANAICLIGFWRILYCSKTAEEAYGLFTSCPPLPAFHDATPNDCTYQLTVMDCLKGLEKAIKCQYFSLSTFNLSEYNHYEKVQNGDLTWLSKKFIAFAGPRDDCPSDQNSLKPEHYLNFFKTRNVTLVVRLNEKTYDESIFIQAGIDHIDLYFPDGCNPPDSILNQFFKNATKTQGVVAVHCKAGLGRTGTCIGCYMIMTEKFTAAEVIGWLRICRPGCVIGPQQDFLSEFEDRLKSQPLASFDEIVPLKKATISKLKFSRPLKVQSNLPVWERTQGDLLNEKKRKIWHKI